MFNRENDYQKATREAQLYTSGRRKSSNRKLIIVNILLLALLGYAGFKYLENNNNMSLSSLPVSKQAVLGVSETVADLTHQESMKVLMIEPSILSKSSYTEAIARKLDDKNGFRGRTAVVNQSDTSSKN